MDAKAVAEAFERHSAVAFQFSGGRDSTAALYLLRSYWDQMRVYHVDTGDQFPELRAAVDAVARDVEITTITTSAPAWRDAVGLPSDVVPFDNTAVGRVLSGRTVAIVGRMECCAANLMDPLHQRVLGDGATLLVRGVRADEFAGDLKLRSGWSDGRVELLYPIERWSAAEVDNYLAEHALPVAPFYAAGMKQAPECMGCTAWWGEGRGDYMKQHHPEAFEAYSAKVRVIKFEINHQLSTLE